MTEVTTILLPIAGMKKHNCLKARLFICIKGCNKHVTFVMRRLIRTAPVFDPGSNRVVAEISDAKMLHLKPRFGT